MLKDSLSGLQKDGWLSPLDSHLARHLCALSGETQPEVMLATALASRQISQGDTCIHVGDAELVSHLKDERGQDFPLPLPARDRWLALLSRSPMVSNGEQARPLVLDPSGRLYLRRYWQHEQRIAQQLLQRAVAVTPAPDPAWLQPRLDALFAPLSDEIDWQRVATTMTLLRQLSVISGGPGTGKTYTVTKILALLIEQAIQQGQRPPRIVLLAPTGKAAARLAETIKKAKLALEVSDQVRDAIPELAATLHRGLGSQLGSSTRFRYRADNPLPADLVLVDEASMVDIGLMARLVDALPQSARLVLLGDRDQLASVEAGAVLGDICDSGHAMRYSKTLRQDLLHYSGQDLGPLHDRPNTGIWDSVVQLHKSYRFNDQGGIGALARAINDGEADKVVTLCKDPAQPEVQLLPGGEHKQAPAALLAQARQAYSSFMQRSDPLQALNQFNQFRVLCALRRGPNGVEELNPRIAAQLAQAGLIQLDKQFYPGRPVMVSRNDALQQLFNGDVGLTLGDDDGGDGTQVCFIAPDGSLRRFAPSWLPPHETVYAMTVHKSQGSEFMRVAILLPPQASPILTRELLYTAVTRAQQEVTIYGDPEILREATRKRIRRQSGLRPLLWGEMSG